MKAWLTDPKCMHLKLGKSFFDNPFTRLKCILCSPLLSLVTFLEITFARITPQTRGKCGKKTSTIESAQTTLGEWKKILNDQRCKHLTKKLSKKWLHNRCRFLNRQRRVWLPSFAADFWIGNDTVKPNKNQCWCKHPTKKKWRRKRAKPKTTSPSQPISESAATQFFTVDY